MEPWISLSRFFFLQTLFLEQEKVINLLTPVPSVTGRNEPWPFIYFRRHHFWPKLASSIFNLPVTCLLCAMWHIRPQHNPANHLSQPLPFVSHSSPFIPFFPFLSSPSLSMLSLFFPFFAAPLGRRLMQSCSYFVVLFSWCGQGISIFSFARPHWGFLSSLFVILFCERILNIRLRHLHWKTSIFFSADLLIFHVSQPYIKTGFTNVLCEGYSWV